MSAKYIFITGGVISSLGKGIASASIGRILEARGLKVTLIKLDPYINVDPGTMNPYQHGEVYVTDDGAETDLDLGHYERFTSARMSKFNNVTCGQVYNTVISRERKGDYLGKTVQVIPHITDEIKARIKKAACVSQAQIVLVEIGGTVGDIESLPFLEAARQIALDIGRKDVLYIHLTLVPYIKAAGEIKTKPTQHSVGTLREIGIEPDILVCRTEKQLSDEVKEKISLFCNVRKEAVIEAKDVASIYEIPLVFKNQGLDLIILEHFGLEPVPKPLVGSAVNFSACGCVARPRRSAVTTPSSSLLVSAREIDLPSRRSASGQVLKCKSRDLKNWRINVVEKGLNPAKKVKIAFVGKYIGLQDAYKSVYEALSHAGIANNAKVEIEKIDSECLEKEETAEKVFRNVSGILVPGGFGSRGIEGKIKAIRFARENKVPFLGLCLGMQCAVIEFSRNVCALKEANSTEFKRQTKYPVISLLEEQRKIKDLGGTMRLGAYPCRIKKNSLAFRIYTNQLILERHRHRYEFNNKYKELLERKGMLFSGMYPDNDLIEIIEIKEHPFFIAVQFHPEFKSKPDNAHPLFREFIKASLGR